MQNILSEAKHSSRPSKGRCTSPGGREVRRLRHWILVVKLHFRVPSQRVAGSTGLRAGVGRSSAMRFVTTQDGTELYVKDWGTGRPVVMLHGWPLSSDTFDDLGMAIANAGMRAIAYDRRGFGRSEQPWNGYDYDTLS